MQWINVFGLTFMLVIMIPNIVFMLKQKNALKNYWHNKIVETLEQIGRFGCFALMVVIIPYTGFGFGSKLSFLIYLLVNIILALLYCIIWVVCFRKQSIFRALALSVLPSVIFLFSGIISNYIPLVIAAIIFAPCHITISYKNAFLSDKNAQELL